MLRDLTIFNPWETINKRIRLPESATIGIGASIKIWKGNFMECTSTIHPTSMVNGLKKSRVRYKPTKRAGPIEQCMVKTQLEIVEVENASLCTDRCSMHCAQMVEYLRQAQQKWLYYTTSKIRGPGWGTSQKMVSDYLLFHLFPTYAPLLHGPKSARLNRIKFSTRKYSLSERYFSPSWRNTLGRILLGTMDDSPVCFTIITNKIS